jgi:hypothetical protein
MASPLTYNPSIDTIVLARAVGALYYAIDGRSTYPDTDRFVRRPFQSLTFVKSYFNNEEFRRGMFSIYVNETGLLDLSTGYIIGGTTKEYWWKEEDLSDDGLIEKSVDLTDYATLTYLDSKVTTNVNTISDLVSYTGLSVNVFVKDEVRGGFFNYTTSETEVVDNGLIFPATGKGAGRWIRYAEQSMPLSRYFDYEDIEVIPRAIRDGSFAREADIANLKSLLMSGKGVVITIMGSSNSAGAVGYGEDGIYGEATGFVNAVGQMIFAMGVLLTDPNFIPLQKAVYPVVDAYNSNNLVTNSANKNRLLIPYHYLATPVNPTLNYTVKQPGSFLLNKLTIYYYVRSSASAPTFDVTTSLGTTTIDTYKAPLTYVEPSTNVTFRLESTTVDIPATREVSFTISNIVSPTDPANGFAAVAGFAFGNGVKINNIAVSSASLKNSSFNITRGITTDERFNLAKSFNTNFYIIQFVDSRTALNTNPYEFKELLRVRVKEVRAVSPNCIIILATNPAALPGEPSGREDIPYYNNAMRELAIEENCSFFDAEKALNTVPSQAGEGVYYDYIHLTALGCNILGNAFFDLFKVENPIGKKFPYNVGRGVIINEGLIHNAAEIGTVGTSGKVVSMTNPDGGIWKAATSADVGAIRITLPTNNANVMYLITGVINMYNPDSALASPVGFNISVQGSNMASRGATFIGSNGIKYPVRFYTDSTAGKKYIYIGELTSSWYFTSLTITHVQASHTGATLETVEKGWSVTLATAFEGTLNGTENNTLPVSGNRIGNSLTNFAALGTLVKTSILITTPSYFTFEVYYHTHSASPVVGRLTLQGLNDNVADLIKSVTATAFGQNINMSVFIYEGCLCLWLPASTVRKYVVACYDDSTTNAPNRVLSMTQEVKPTTGVTRLVDITPLESEFKDKVPILFTTSITLSTSGIYIMSPASTTNRTLTLPIISLGLGKNYTIYNNSSFNLVINGGNPGSGIESSISVDGVALSTYTLRPNMFFSMYFDGSMWVVLFSTKTIVDTTSTPYTKATINATYPNVGANTIVIQDGANQTYIKKDNSPTGNWSVFPTIQLT